MAAPTPSKVSLKLLVDKKAKKVLFAEAGNDMVDFLCSILTIPVGTVIRLLLKQGMVGSLSNLYRSIESLNDDYIQPNKHKDLVLKPMAASTSFPSNSLVLRLTDAPKKEKKFYRCGHSHNHNFLTDKSGSIKCPSCHNLLTHEVTFLEGNAAGVVAGGGSGGAGFVKGVITYMIMDDLAVAPMSTITGITLLNKFNVTDVGALEEKVVDLDMDKALKLLKISLQSKNVLTTVFL